MAQAGINIAAALGAISGPLIIGAMTKGDLQNGWRNYYVSLLIPSRFATSNNCSGFKWDYGV